MPYNSEAGNRKRINLLPEQIEVHEILGTRNFQEILRVFQRYVKAKAKLESIPYSTEKYFALYRAESKECFPHILEVLRDISHEDPTFLASFDFSTFDDDALFDRMLKRNNKKVPESKGEPTMQLEVIANSIY